MGVGENRRRLTRLAVLLLSEPGVEIVTTCQPVVECRLFRSADRGVDDEDDDEVLL